MTAADSREILVETRDLNMWFPIRGGVLNRVKAHVHAVNGVDIAIRRGETVGLVGESGCGKSTLGKTIVRLLEPTSGQVLYRGQDITRATRSELAPLRRKMQIVFQDPHASLNPRLTVEAMLGEVLRFHGVVEPSAVDRRIDELLELCGLRSDMRRRFPHEFSGGQRQRLGIARALSVEPEFIMADEPVSALDVSIQAQLLNLMMDLREQLGLTILFISHDLKVVEHLCDRVLIMYLGKVVEEIDADRLRTVRHPYTQALLDAIPIDDPSQRRERQPLAGDVPSPIQLPSGCAFHGRCPIARPSCSSDVPVLTGVDAQHRVACPVVLEKSA